MGTTVSQFSENEISLSEIQQLDAASLSKLIAELQQSKADLEAKRFVETSLAKFADLMRWQSTDDLSSWVERLLAEMANTVGALQACMYMTSLQNMSEGELPELILSGTYAHDEETTLPVIKFGKGLIGQAAKSKRATVFNRNAKIETRTYTGLALLHPQALVIQPLIYNEKVEGVLEVSSVEEFSPQQIDFIRLLSESIAANMMTIRSQEEMKRLYLEMQTKTESMTAQEEEMRQNMEEMAATQDELARLRDQAEQQSALQSSTIDSFQDGIIAVDSKLNIMLYNTAAEKLASVLGDVLEKNKPIESYYSEDIKAEQKGHWIRAINGDSFSSEEKRKTSDGHELTFLFRFTPIFNLKRTEMLGACALLRNITEDRKRQNEIENLKNVAERQSNFLQSLLDGMQDGIIAIDSKLNIRLLNHRTQVICDKFELPIKVGDNLIDKISSNNQDEFRKFCSDALKGEMVSITIVYQFTDNDPGSWYEVSFIPIIETDGRVSGVIVQFKNVHERIEQSSMLESLRINAVHDRNLRQSLIDNIDSGLVAIDKDYNLTIANRPAFEIFSKFGIELKENSFFPDALNPDFKDKILLDWQNAMKGETVNKLNEYKFSDDDTVRLYESIYSPVFTVNDANPEENIVDGVVLLFRDVTETMKQTHQIEKLRDESEVQKSYLESIFNSYTNPMIAVDRNYCVTAFNQHASRFFSIQNVNLSVGQNIAMIYGTRYNEIANNYRKVLENGESFTDVEIYNENSDYMLALEASYGPIFNDKKEIVGACVFTKDITDLKIQEQILQRKNDEMRKNLEKMSEIQNALKIEKEKNEQLLKEGGAASSQTEIEEKTRQIAEKNYAKFKSQIDNLSEQLTNKDSEIKKLKAQLENKK